MIVEDSADLTKQLTSASKRDARQILMFDHCHLHFKLKVDLTDDLPTLRSFMKCL